MKNAKQIEKSWYDSFKIDFDCAAFFFLICFSTATEFSCKYELYYKEN